MRQEDLSKVYKDIALLSYQKPLTATFETLRLKRHLVFDMDTLINRMETAMQRFIARCP